MAIDLQSHSTVSDGELVPSEVVKTAASQGVEVLALTDHDAFDGVTEAAKTGRQLGVEVIPAVEFSSVHPYCQDLHVVGYWLEASGRLSEVLAKAQQNRLQRANAIAKALHSQGIHLDVNHAVELAGGAKSLGRPHLARAVLDEAQNSVAMEGVGGTSGFIAEFLTPGKPGFVPRTWPATEEIVALIAECGGLAVWAHPFWDLDDSGCVTTVLDELVPAGLFGVEAFYPTHSKEQTAFLVQQSSERELVTTASSDFHGPNHKIFSKFLSYDTYGLGEPQVPHL